MERAVRSGERRAYASAVADLWERLGSALARLERLADAPVGRIATDAADELPSLQYGLHAGAELALGIEPPPGAETVHAELVAALAHARDATAEVAAALDERDEDLVERLLPEWRGALFRVRRVRRWKLERIALERPRRAGARPRPRSSRPRSSSPGRSSSPPGPFSRRGPCGRPGSRFSRAASSSSGRNRARAGVVYPPTQKPLCRTASRGKWVRTERKT